MFNKKLIILAVDDDFINIKLLKSFLSKDQNEPEIIEARNGEEALVILKKRNDIDIILLDIIMPIMNGLEMLKILRTDEKLHQIPVIMLTTDETKKSEALECGANGFITEPIRSHDVVEQINKLLL